MRCTVDGFIKLLPVHPYDMHDVVQTEMYSKPAKLVAFNELSDAVVVEYEDGTQEAVYRSRVTFG